MVGIFCSPTSPSDAAGVCWELPHHAKGSLTSFSAPWLWGSHCQLCWRQRGLSLVPPPPGDLTAQHIPAVFDNSSARLLHNPLSPPGGICTLSSPAASAEMWGLQGVSGAPHSSLDKGWECSPRGSRRAEATWSHWLSSLGLRTGIVRGCQCL